ncbi:MAG TPA: hypothetical protein VL175_15415 [Pirellulales bacterium]|jgi:uncharacterized protein YbaR (Trm112 family)|nr:hypothetical protein [Pirellulales bacterium]
MKVQMIREELARLLVCPEKRTALSVADAALVARLNREIAAGRVKNRAGQPLEKQLTGGLVRADGKVFYPIVDEIPMMLIDESILLEDGELPAA